MPLILSPTQIAFNARGDGKFNKPFTEQVDFFRQKENRSTQWWDDILNAEHDRAFIVAGAAKADLLNDLRGAVDKAIAEGKSIQWFRQNFDDIVAKHGWQGWTGSDTQAGRDWRTRVIYSTNMRASYAAGRYAQLTDPDLLKNRPFWKYIHSDLVAHPRPLHQSWSGMVLRWDDPFWHSHYPPNGFGCRCRIKAVTASEYKGLPAPDDGTYTKIDRRGVAHELPNGVDYGWGYAPGASVTQQMRGFIADKASALPSALGQALLSDIATLPQAPVFEPQTSPKLCSKWAMDNDLVDYADYGAIKVDVANEMNKLLLSYINEFQALRPAQKFIGTGQLQFKRWQQIASKDYLDGLIEAGYSQEDAKKIIDRYYKKPKMNGSTLMHSWEQPEASGIAVNDKWGKNPQAFSDALDRTVATEYHPVGCNTIKSVIDHEFGHQLDDLLNLSAHSSSISQLYNAALQAGIKGEVSGYAGTSIQEFIAECWAEFKNNPNPRYFSTQVAKLIKDEYEKRFPS